MLPKADVIVQPNPLGVRGLDHIEFWVGNPRQAAHFYKTTFGLALRAYGGMETGLRDRSSHVVGSGDVCFVLTGAIDPKGPIAAFVHTHGDAVRDVALRVDNVEKAFHEAVSRGAKPISEPTLHESEAGTVRHACIAAFGDVVHSLVERSGNQWAMPNIAPVPPAPAAGVVHSIDHVAVGLPEGTLAEQTAFYKDVCGFTESQHAYVATGQSAMNSTVVESPNGAIKLPLVEAARSRGRSQVQEYLDFNRGPGVQHAALLTDDILRSVSQLRRDGIDFLSAPGAYYEQLRHRVGEIEEDTAALRALDILVDRDSWGYLMQIFSKPVQSRPTFFVEVIQRKGAKGFGSGNIKALFEAVEAEQRRRSNV